MMIRFLRSIWRTYRKEMKLSEIEYKRNKLLGRMGDLDVDVDELQVEWARLEHEERKLRDENYAKMCKQVEEANRKRKIEGVA